MPDLRVSNRSSASIDSPEPEPTPTPSRPSTTHAAQRSSAPSHGPAVVVDRDQRTAAQARLQHAMGRIHGSGSPGAPIAAPRTSQAADHQTLVNKYVGALRAGVRPELPVPPPLPQMSGAEILGRVGARMPNMNERLERAIRDRELNTPESVVHLALEFVTGPLADAMHMDRAELAHRLDLGLDIGLATGAAVTEGLHLAGAEVLSTMDHALAAIAIADATQYIAHDLINIARGREAPTPAIIDALRAELPRRLAEARGRLERNASAAFDSGTRAAALGRPMSSDQARDPAFALGYRQGQEYRRQHGDAYGNHAAHLRALNDATQQVQAELHPQGEFGGHVATIGPVRTTVGAEIDLEQMLNQDH